MIDIMFKIGAVSTESLVNKLVDTMFREEAGRYGTAVLKRKPTVFGKMMGEKPVSKRITYEVPQQQAQPGGVTVGPKGKVQRYTVQEPEVYTVRSTSQSTRPGLWSRYGKYVGPALGIGALGGLMLAPKVTD
jgi:hypothetical protein